MLLFRQKTGESVCVLHDEAYLTDVRTAVAGAISAKYLAPKTVSSIGVIGTGQQARLQVEYLQDVVDCKEVAVWGPAPACLPPKLHLRQPSPWRHGPRLRGRFQGHAAGG